jgi:hypothetical protein
MKNAASRRAGDKTLAGTQADRFGQNTFGGGAWWELNLICA